MSELTTWQSVQHVKPTPELEKLVDAGNSFASWPPYNKAHVMQSMRMGVDCGHVDPKFDPAVIVGAVSYVQSDVLELRATWEPPKDQAAA